MNKQQKPFFLVKIAFLVLLGFSCKTYRDGDSNIRFLVLDDLKSSLMHYVKDKEIKLCFVETSTPPSQSPGGEVFPDLQNKVAASLPSLSLAHSGVSSQTKLNTSQDIKASLVTWSVQAIETWLRNLDSIRPSKDLPQIKLLDKADGCNDDPVKNANMAALTIIVLPEVSREFYSTDHITGWVTISKETNYGIFLHELGHAFGLADIYDLRGTAGKCRLGHKPSVMCGSPVPYDQLQEDDIDGIQYIYCQLFPADNPRACQGIKPPGIQMARQHVSIEDTLGVKVQNYPGPKDNPQIRANNEKIIKAQNAQAAANVSAGTNAPRPAGYVPLPPLSIIRSAVMVMGASGKNPSLLPQGVVIVRINDMEIKTVDDLAQALKLAWQNTLDFEIYRVDHPESGTETVTLTLSF